jgi:hypothetical protein
VYLMWCDGERVENVANFWHKICHLNQALSEKWCGCDVKIVFFVREDVMSWIVKGERMCVDVTGEMMVNSGIGGPLRSVKNGGMNSEN